MTVPESIIEWYNEKICGTFNETKKIKNEFNSSMLDYADGRRTQTDILTDVQVSSTKYNPRSRAGSAKSSFSTQKFQRNMNRKKLAVVGQ